jgi:hypothetical protein
MLTREFLRTVDLFAPLSDRDADALIILSGLLKKLGGRLRKTSEAVQTLVRSL